MEKTVCFKTDLRTIHYIVAIELKCTYICFKGNEDINY